MYLPRCASYVAALLLAAGGFVAAAQLEVIDLPGVTLAQNPLGDPAARQVALFSPEESTKDDRLPMVIYLPGWGGSSRDLIAAGRTAWLGRVTDFLKERGFPVRIAVPDCRSRYGGSQYIDSEATGPYGTYLARELIPALDARYGSPGSPALARVIAGHSSGGYGALLFAMDQQVLCPAVVALSPDSDFEVTHRPLVEDAAVRAVTTAELNAAMAPPSEMHLPGNGLAGLIMGLCANYTPAKGHPGRFDWLYDRDHHWQPAVWKRWLDQDPYLIVKTRPAAFATTQRVYLDGAEHDEFGANIGARKIYELLKPRGIKCAFTETPGSHSDRLPERLEAGLEWVFSQK